MRRACLGLLVALSFACQESDPGADLGEESGPSKSNGKTKDASTSKPDASSGSKGTDGKGTDSTGKADAGAKKQLPCDVKAVLDEHCASCHAATPQFGAPMALASVADFHAQSPRAKSPYYSSAAERIQRTGPGTMPPSPKPPLSEAAQATLLDWLEAGAPASNETCEDAPGKPAVDGGVSPGQPGEVSETDCDVSFELRAYDDEPGAKFPIPQEDDHYECFYFKSTVDAKTLATSLAPLLDDTRVLHHWLLFASENENEAPSGTHRRCDGIHPGAFLMAAWLPGTPALVLPDDVGMEFPKSGTAQLILENHYNNTARYQGASDNSGVKVCATKKPKATRAAMHWLGSELITLPPMANGSATGTCAPQNDEPIHLMGVIPHMHRLGRHVKMTILRANGGQEVMHDQPFEFESQTYFEKNAVLQPGDRITTKCDYVNDTRNVVTLGEKTTQEMCYMFTLAYPVGSMNTGGDYVNPLTGEPYVQGPNRCMK